MTLYEGKNGELLADGRPAKWCQWTLAVADVDGKLSGRGKGIVLPRTKQGLPGGEEVKTEEELFQKYKVNVEGETSMPTPGGGTAELSVKFRAKQADDFTGAQLRTRKVDREAGEVNQLQAANVILYELMRQFKKDMTASVNDLQKKEQRKKLAEALRALAKAL
jgi:hypothetical protein